MAIELTRTQILDLMRELDGHHWFQKPLLDELAKTSSHNIDPAPVPEPDFTISAKPNFEKTVEKEISTDEERQCKWQTYGYRCRENSTEDFCEEHRVVCREQGCNNMADHGCPCELQFVCGYPLCSAHTSCSSHYRPRY